VLNHALYRERDLTAAERKRRQRQREREQRDERHAVTGRDVTEDRRQKAEDRERTTEQGGLGGSSQRGNGGNGATTAGDMSRDVPGTAVRNNGHGAATAKEMQRLGADPELADIGDAWVQAFGRQKRELGVLRAARTALAGGYSLDAIKLVVRVVALAREAPERFPDRGSIRWAVEHGKRGIPPACCAPTLDRHPEAETWERRKGIAWALSGRAVRARADHRAQPSPRVGVDLVADRLAADT
jgi:hypothetical protein